MAKVRGILKDVIRCRICHNTILIQGFTNKSSLVPIMQREKICYECAYWKRMIDYPPKNIEIIGNQVYRVLPLVDKPDKSMVLGGEGKMRYILKFDNTLIKSNDIWKVGTIPVRFQLMLPPTAWWVTREFYRKWNKEKQICRSKRCFDRYHCFRYDFKSEYRDGPFNQVPLDWIVGTEECPYFININQIQGYFTNPLDLFE